MVFWDHFFFKIPNLLSNASHFVTSEMRRDARVGRPNGWIRWM
jgi:hypothetical protein